MSEASEPLAYDLTPVEVPVTIGDKNYVLREAGSDAACRYQNAMLSDSKMGADGKPVMSLARMADLEPFLVSLCLFNGDGTVNVPLATIRKWPARVVKDLHKRAMHMSGLDAPGTEEGEAAEDVAKNELSGMPDAFA